jgi:hypothetical protein
MREHYELMAEAENDPAFLADVRSLYRTAPPLGLCSPHCTYREMP